MSDSNEGIGSCICGAVQILAQNINNHVCACHCETCRKWGGGPYMSIECGKDVTFKGKENISVFDSSDWADRGFCGQCGSHLFYRLKESSLYFMPVALFGDNSSLIFDRQVLIEEKPAFYSFANKTDEITGAELFAKYTDQSV